MRALILAAGRGQRLRPLTDTTPKPLLSVHGHRLIDWQLAACKRAGINEVVINTAHLADAFEELPAQLRANGIRASISREGDTHEAALESLGGIVHALPLIAPEGDDTPFLVLAGDVVHDFDLSQLIERAADIQAGRIVAHLVGVVNPNFHRTGDMTVHEDGSITPGEGPHTYACLMIVTPRIFRREPERAAKLFPWLWQFARDKRISGQVHHGLWRNVGSGEQLAALQNDTEALRWAQL